MPELNSTGLTPRAWTAGDEILVINEGGGSPDTIARINSSVPLSMLADLATSTILGRVTSGSGAIEELTAAQVRTLLNVADGAQVNVPTDLAYTASTRSLTSSTGTDVTLPLVTSTEAGLTPASGGGTSNFLRADLTWSAFPTVTSIVGITGTKAQFDTAVTDGNFMYVGDAPTSHTHVAADITDFSTAVAATAAVTANTAKVSNATHTGDVTGSTALTISDGVVTLAKQADVATSTVFYRKSAGTGSPEVQTLATLKTDLGLTGTNSGDQTSIVGITGTKAQFDAAVTDGNILYVGDVTQYTDEMAQDAIGAMVDGSLIYTDGTPLLQRAGLTGAVTASAGSNTTSLGSFTKAQLDAAVTDGDVLYVGDITSNATHTGDVTGSTTLTIANDVVTNAKAANMATATIKGRVTAGTGDPEDLTGTQATTLLDTFTSGLKGLAPASGGGTTNFLRADGTWAAAGGGGSPAWGSITGTLSSQTDLQTALDDKVSVGDQIDLPAATPVVPAADHVGVFGRKISGRMMLGAVGPSGLDTALQPFFGRNKVGYHQAHGNGTTVTSIGISVATTGTATTANVATTNKATSMRRLEYAVTTASTTAVAGIRSGMGLQFFRGASSRDYGGFFYVCRFGRGRGVAANATLRGFNGLTSISSAPTDAEPSTNVTNAIGVGCDAADTNWQIIHRNNTAAATKIDTGFAKAVADNSEMYELALFSPPGVDDTVYYQFTRLSDNATFEGVATTNLPTATTLMSFRNYYSVGGTSSVIGLMHASIYIETDF